MMRPRDVSPGETWLFIPSVRKVVFTLQSLHYIAYGLLGVKIQILHNISVLRSNCIQGS